MTKLKDDHSDKKKSKRKRDRDEMELERALAKAEKKLAKAEAALAAARHDAAGADPGTTEKETFAEEKAPRPGLPPELSQLLKATGKSWQGKVEASLALWLDEASLALRKDGLDGLSNVLKAKTGRTKLNVTSGASEARIESAVRTAVDGIGRDIAGAALAAAFATFTAGKGAAPGEGKAAGKSENPDKPKGSEGGGPTATQAPERDKETAPFNPER
tara:strand:+ start:11663 stop:12313 length:651 start_codon:yes stop_codon:yes gene_type:complete